MNIHIPIHMSIHMATTVRNTATSILILILILMSIHMMEVTPMSRPMITSMRIMITIISMSMVIAMAQR
jgi:hypothetical protein